MPTEPSNEMDVHLGIGGEAGHRAVKVNAPIETGTMTSSSNNIFSISLTGKTSLCGNAKLKYIFVCVKERHEAILQDRPILVCNEKKRAGNLQEWTEKNIVTRESCFCQLFARSKQ